MVLNAIKGVDADVLVITQLDESVTNPSCGIISM